MAKVLVWKYFLCTLDKHTSIYLIDNYTNRMDHCNNNNTSARSLRPNPVVYHDADSVFITMPDDIMTLSQAQMYGENLTKQVTTCFKEQDNVSNATVSIAMMSRDDLNIV